MFPSYNFLASCLVAWSLFASHVAAITVQGTILVFARSTTEAYSATAGLNGHGIPFQLVIVPQAGVTLPTLSSSSSAGNYGGIITLSELSYEYDGGVWESAITDAQWEQLYAYQAAFGVRMVRLDAFPESQFGKSCWIARNVTALTADQAQQPQSLMQDAALMTLNSL